AIRTLSKDECAFVQEPNAERFISSHKEKREIRHASDDFSFPVTMYLYDDKLSIISSKEEDFALIVQSRELSRMQSTIFAMIWAALNSQ
ncbi:MAG: hypothetical protein KDD53_10300, partial [Bdellovibrionales bacterium]|nr:hypothetical protein [Bdellovibrionales bacterium]